MDILVEQGLDPASKEYIFIKYSLLSGDDYFKCQEWCRLPIISPYRHLLRLDYVALDSERCTFLGCGNHYEMITEIVIGMQTCSNKLIGADIQYAGMYSPMHSSNKLKPLTMFQHDQNCMVVLMDGNAAVGLD
ncbi:hypothetical protein H6P81_006899 [Aristolochia fimbriata]|uniref:Uncharacterized protein n=1 Tax=Aristolochia fimbriata TaxID=158543 RepID=A0AAV7EYJ7_ARIFI|nr:hypothetical protein H6P81_006899 [Aristolochia fimbriata]